MAWFGAGGFFYGILVDRIYIMRTNGRPKIICKYGRLASKSAPYSFFGSGARRVSDWLQYYRFAIEIVQGRRNSIGDREEYDIHAGTA
ncbi:hypothetical protein SDC9_206540 [bioreactor metagenome]|uniref:Uncharacterized protein n=1 Tax=bioreactor metagenome TaxID=1076179 RepID=A0A645J532_9ZZZZ